MRASPAPTRLATAALLCLLVSGVACDDASWPGPRRPDAAHHDAGTDTSPTAARDAEGEVDEVSPDTHASTDEADALDERAVVCAWIPALGEHRECHHMAAGECVGYGGWCASACMYVPQAGEYRTCHAASAGLCLHASTWCEVDCMFIPEEGEYRTCHFASTGRCQHVGTWCEPAPTPPL